MIVMNNHASDRSNSEHNFIENLLAAQILSITGSTIKFE